MLISFPQFPSSSKEPFEKTSEFDSNYNCIAWAAGDSDKWYEPDPYGIYFWPHPIPREYTIEAYVKLYEHLGYVKCINGELEDNFEKVAIFSNDGIRASHAARQINTGLWTSKLGKEIDVSHTLFSMNGGFYGNVIKYLKRQIIP